MWVSGVRGYDCIINKSNTLSVNSFLHIFAGDVGKTSDDISLTLVESCSHDHGKHAQHQHTNKTLSHVSGCDFSSSSLMFLFFPLF